MRPLHYALLMACPARVVRLLLDAEAAALPRDEQSVRAKAGRVGSGLKAWLPLMCAWPSPVAPLEAIQLVYRAHPGSIEVQGRPLEHIGRYKTYLNNEWTNLHAAVAHGAPSAHICWLLAVAPQLAHQERHST
jgi:hypothetical protein